MKKVNWKTLIPALVAGGILVYEAQTGHKISESVQSQMVNDFMFAVGIVGTVWGFIKNHMKG